jgi:hypothetical protein
MSCQCGNVVRVFVDDLILIHILHSTLSVHAGAAERCDAKSKARASENQSAERIDRIAMHGSWQVNIWKCGKASACELTLVSPALL